MARNLKSILGVTAGLLIVGATSATPCQGDPLFFARADVVLEGSIADQDSNQDSAPVSAFAAAGPGVGSAIARGGAIGTSSSVSTPLNAQATNSAFAAASFAINDVIFTNTTGETTFTGSANFLLHGFYSVKMLDLGGLFVTSISTLQLSASADGGAVNGAYIAEFDSGGNFQLSSSGVLAGLSGGPSDEVKVPFSIPISGLVNTPMTVEAIMDVNTVASLGTSGSSDFGGTLSFALSGPVFALPSGWTANSVSGNIVDNRFGGAAVPEPGALTLLASGALLLLGLARRARCGSGSSGGPRPSLVDYVTVREPADGAPAAGGCKSCLRS